MLSVFEIAPTYISFYLLGTDASQAFEDTFHSDHAREMMAEYYCGELVDTVEGELCFEVVGAEQVTCCLWWLYHYASK